MRQSLLPKVVFACSGLVAASVAVGQEGESIDVALARQYFEEARALSERDGGALWGKELYGPMMFADRATRLIVANRADSGGRLQAEGNVFVGVLPPEVNIANTALSFGGMKWTMVVWPLPSDRLARGLLMMHELWHRIQDDIGFPSTGPANAHLDSVEGRTWMRLEWAALRKAVQSQGDIRRNAIEDALVFRGRRRAIFPSAGSEEQALEMHEGLANFTGAALAGRDVSERATCALRELDAGEAKPTYVRSFAYSSGPVYGLLLDALAPGWRKGLTPKNDLGELLGSVVGFKTPTDVEAGAARRSSAYGDRIVREETERESKRREKTDAARAKFVEGPTLRLPLVAMKISFDPDNLIPLADAGTVYPTARIVDSWGVLTVTDGALIDKNWSSVTVAAPADPTLRPLTGSGWSLELAQGWMAVPSIRANSYELRRAP